MEVSSRSPLEISVREAGRRGEQEHEPEYYAKIGKKGGDAPHRIRSNQSK